MVDILERSAQRLRLRFAGRGLGEHICTFDRGANVAQFERRAWFIPLGRRTVALSDIYNVAVRRRSRRKLYSTILEIRVGGDLPMGGYGKDEALEAARAIRDFLRQPANSSASLGG